MFLQDVSDYGSPHLCFLTIPLFVVHLPPFAQTCQVDNSLCSFASMCFVNFFHVSQKFQLPLLVASSLLLLGSIKPHLSHTLPITSSTFRSRNTSTASILFFICENDQLSLSFQMLFSPHLVLYTISEKYLSFTILICL